MLQLFAFTSASIAEKPPQPISQTPYPTEIVNATAAGCLALSALLPEADIAAF
jgi:hypothetical protein